MSINYNIYSFVLLLIYNYLYCIMRTKHIILSLILLSQLSFAQGQAGSLFLTINPGARSNAMGEAQIGVANDAYATYYNPAGLTNLSSKEFSFCLLYTSDAADE